ncbi:uncharacterized protein LOC126824468 [Patella vulgata]|uniref:uncharacterized protein LOC126824468 n=1 Tax=Patella vulgata TaxID=6465 RepID=UPI00217F9A37|nr:uncharacterized protein LOC126824468 [Patella vulgata]
MGDDNVAVLSQVRKEVIELRQLGEQWGLSQTEINSCIDTALNTKLETASKEIIAKKMQSEKKWGTIRFVFRVWLAIVIFISGFTVMLTQIEYLSDVYRLLDPYRYDFLGMVRLLSLPLHERHNISSYHNEVCLIENPYFEEEEEADCLFCDRIESHN